MFFKYVLFYVERECKLIISFHFLTISSGILTATTLPFAVIFPLADNVISEIALSRTSRSYRDVNIYNILNPAYSTSTSRTD